MVSARADFGLGIVRRPAAASGLVSRGQAVEGESFGLGPGLTIANRPIRRRVALVGKLSRAECRMHAGRLQAARRDRLMAGTSQSGAQVGRRKPVIQGGPAEKILSGSPRAGYGRDFQFTDVPVS